MDLRIFTEPQQGASHSDLLAVARATRDGGFSAFFRSDHILRMGDRPGLPGPSDSFVTLGAIAAQIDDISDGRMELGLGSGWYKAEHTAYGLDFGASFGDRFDRLTEQLEVITGLWATPQGAGFQYTGRHYRLSGAPGLPKPRQRNAGGTPGLPIIVGGHGPRRTPALAARFADEFNVGFVDMKSTIAQFDRVRAACDQAGRDPGSLVYSTAHPVCVGQDEAEFERRAAAIGRTPEEARTSPFAGTVQQVVDSIGAWGAAGVQRSYLQVLDLGDLDHLSLLAAEVLPAVRC